ncbi:MAG: NAD(P)H-quinone oxidoreductase [Gammaproteobacteria bacterium]|nr:NAD(P)H-quinone oxidoreductase [Gammaproteobacteria bacterium]
MRYVDHGSGGGVEVMHLADRAVPQPGAGEVLVEVACAGVNRPDVLQRAGSYPPPPGASPILGLEVSGRIAAVDAGCRRWRVGDMVCALVPGGGYAEYCVTPEAHCLPVPDGLSPAEAAGLPETYFTVWASLFGQGRLSAGQTALIHGGASGIGVAAIQLARAFGARAATTVGSADKAGLCRELGADPVINYREQDFVAVLRRCGVHPDVVLDIVGGSYTARNLEVLARDGRLVQVGLLGGAQATVPLGLVLAKRLTITGSTMRGRTIEEKAAIAGELEQKVWPLFAAGRLHPVLYRVFPLQQVVQAHRLMESGAHFGKIVLAVSDL